MSAPQPTPGPWRYDPVWSLVTGPQGGEQQICAIHGSELVPKHQAAANAALIARAPDLLAEVERLRAALRDVLRYCVTVDGPEQQAALDAARAALA